jgi:hypothetical protein
MSSFPVFNTRRKSKQLGTHAEKRKSCSCFQPGILSHSSLTRYNTFKEESTLPNLHKRRPQPEEAVTADATVGLNPAEEGKTQADTDNIARSDSDSELQPGAGE